MASISEIMYEETRSRDGTTFSKKLNVKVTLDVGEGAFDVSKPIPQLLGLSVSHVVDFVHHKIVEGPSEDFKTADKVPPTPTPDKPEVAPPKAAELDYRSFAQVQKDEAKAETPRPTGPAVGPRPFGTPAPAAEQKLTVIKCSVCGSECERRESKASPGSFYKHCPKCGENRQANGKPFTPKGA